MANIYTGMYWKHDFLFQNWEKGRYCAIVDPQDFIGVYLPNIIKQIAYLLHFWLRCFEPFIVLQHSSTDNMSYPVFKDFDKSAFGILFK